MPFSTKKLDEKQINSIKMLRANGVSYRQISDALNVSYGSAQKYGKNVTFLPKSMRKNPFELLSPEINPEQYEKRIPNPENYQDDAAKEWWTEHHKSGTRFEGPLNLFSITELQEIMEEPTDYHSQLSMAEWAQYYLEGPDNFLRHAPFKWGDGQLEIFNLWEKHGKLMIKCHRGFGKTVAIDAILTREICENREKNYAICSQTDREARRRVKHVGDMFLKNKKLIADYGFLPHQKIYKGTRQSWTKSEITVKREISQTDPTLMCLSSESKSSTGPHFDGIVFDDVWSRLLDRNKENKEKWLEWYDGELEGTLERAWEMWIYTRKSPTDLYQTFEDKQYYVIVEKPAFIKYPSQWHIEYKQVNGQKVFDKIIVESKDWIVSDPSRFTPEFFLEKRMKMNTAEWESEFQLNPVARIGKYWKWKDLRFIDTYHDFFILLKNQQLRNKARIIGSMDIATGSSARADYTALAIVAYFAGKYYFLDLFLERGASINDTVRMLAAAKKRYNDMETVYVEADFQQSARAAELKTKANFLHILPTLARQEQRLIEKVVSDRKEVNLVGKPLRIWATIESIIEDNCLMINKGMDNFREFKDEFITFPRCEHFDVLDALSTGIFKMKKKGAIIFALHG